MGYTHYWNTPLKDVDQKTWDAIATDFSKVVSDPKILALLDQEEREEYSQKLRITSDEILFNGVGELSHETFILERKFTPNSFRPEEKENFGFCKTARKPYDVCVTACLIIAHHHIEKQPDNYIKVSSDGETEDWMDGIKLCEKVLDYGFEYEINSQGELGAKA